MSSTGTSAAPSRGTRGHGSTITTTVTTRQSAEAAPRSETGDEDEPPRTSSPMAAAKQAAKLSCSHRGSRTSWKVKRCSGGANDRERLIVPPLGPPPPFARRVWHASGGAVGGTRRRSMSLREGHRPVDPADSCLGCRVGKCVGEAFERPARGHGPPTGADAREATVARIEPDDARAELVATL